MRLLLAALLITCLAASTSASWFTVCKNGAPNTCAKGLTAFACNRERCYLAQDNTPRPGIDERLAVLRTTPARYSGTNFMDMPLNHSSCSSNLITGSVDVTVHPGSGVVAVNLMNPPSSMSHRSWYHVAFLTESTARSPGPKAQCSERFLHHPISLQAVNPAETAPEKAEFALLMDTLSSMKAEVRVFRDQALIKKFPAPASTIHPLRKLAPVDSNTYVVATCNKSPTAPVTPAQLTASPPAEGKAAAAPAAAATKADKKSGLAGKLRRFAGPAAPALVETSVTGAASVQGIDSDDTTEFFVTTNGGGDWTRVSTPDVALRDVKCTLAPGFPGVKGFVCIATVMDGDTKSVLVSNDGARTWKATATVSSGCADMGQVFITPSLKTVSVSYVTSKCQIAVMVSKDLGQTWERIYRHDNGSYRPVGVRVNDDGTGYVAGRALGSKADAFDLMALSFDL